MPTARTAGTPVRIPSISTPTAACSTRILQSPPQSPTSCRDDTDDPSHYPSCDVSPSYPLSLLYAYDCQYHQYAIVLGSIDSSVIHTVG